MAWLLLVACALLSLLALADWDFEVILKNAEKRYGNLGPARQRILDWSDLIQRSGELPEKDKLTAVNRFFNAKLRFVDDQRNWGQNDYWATPIEALVKGAGDCEDYSIAKYFTLRRLGIPAEKLRITYVKALNYNQAHMVLTFYATPTADPLVLDNLISDIRPASQRKDLLPVYAFNAEGLYTGGKRSGDSKKLSRWQDILQKMRAEGFPIGEG
ncbi:MULTISPECIES: cysteine protease LapG [Pseudomonadaceae]|jgi:predicted transglutaminase-like cysteine proteinase|nr:MULTISPECIES: transglutaminase-like cysteine peptidase [Pseudomonas]MDL5591718.1 transglutaminase-like cysteine peptidase [Bacillus subtilis]KIV68115.1 T1SS associated transglutaminase-like cysteine proteinase LapP [Pseudomonas sp. FeS53a]MDH0338034.1 transglutaminase-like cysteine peptidase [Pseudomonas otitidis]MDH1107612.1 transglutaminase-like cysteine peptidase [Pseudomonas otitidis]MDH1160131.1 transglutaminase-like cysteine peptidase [Pseudomonas otitidis]